MEKYESILSKEKIFWRQNSKQIWIMESDRNAKFFHNSIKQRRIIYNIAILKSSNGNAIDDPGRLSKQLSGFSKKIE